MKIDSKDFRVRPGEKFKLRDWPTIVKPFYQSKEQYRKFLGEHVEALSSLQQLHYASNRYALLLIFQAGMMVLSKEHPQVIRYRSAESVLTPVLPQERHGTVGNVVFPTGIDRRDDLGLPSRFDVYYGMADKRIGAARLDLPDSVRPGGVADPPKAKV
jgi:hypothetical protein